MHFFSFVKLFKFLHHFPGIICEISISEIQSFFLLKKVQIERILQYFVDLLLAPACVCIAQTTDSQFTVAFKAIQI